MFRKNLLHSLCLLSFILAGAMAASGQNFVVRGRVDLQQADGSYAPAIGATIDTYRVDIKSKGPSASAGKNGSFSFAGLQLGGTYVLSVSAPGASPRLIPNIKGSSPEVENLVVKLEPGNGKRLTEEEVRAGLLSTSAPSSGGGESAEQRKAREEQEKKNAEILAKNKKIEDVNKIVEEALKTGNEAFMAKNYDVAIAKYDEGYNADPAYIGSAPIFLNNKATAYNNRGTDRYNAAVKSNDTALKESAKQDFLGAYEAAEKSYKMVSAPESITEAGSNTNKTKIAYDALAQMTRALQLMTTTKLDTSKAAEILTGYTAFMAAETDAAKKAKLQLTMADLLRETGDCDSANKEYVKLLAEKPDDADALAGSGLCLVNIGFITEKKETLQEGLNVLQRFVDVAPDTHKLKADARNTIEYLKTEQKLTPQKPAKTATPVRKKT
jgi:hypothetical protein